MNSAAIHAEATVARSQSGDASETWINLNPDSLHDLAGPIHQISSMVELLVRKHQGLIDQETETLIGFIRNSADRLDLLLEGLNRYSEATGSSGVYLTTALNELLSNSLKSLREVIRQSEAVVTHDSLPEVHCDPSRVTYVFGSLIENALKFRREVKPEIHVSAVAHDEDWVLSIRDNGIGIAPAYHQRIFGVFKRVHQGTYPGAGVGLSIVQRIIEDHGGRIWVESEPGQGATFFFTLPRQGSSKGC